MTFQDIASFAANRGFAISEMGDVYSVRFERTDGIVVEASFPRKELNHSTIASWQFVLKDEITGKELYRDWLELDEETPEELDKNIKVEVWEFVDLVSSVALQIKEDSVLSLFGWKIGKYKQLEFQTKSGWRDLWSDKPNEA